MSQRSSVPTTKAPAEQVMRDIRRATRKHHSAEDKIRIVLEGLRGEDSIAALCRREGIAESLYYAWSKEFLEAGKRRLVGDTARAATSDEDKISDARPGSSRRSSPSRRSSFAGWDTCAGRPTIPRPRARSSAEFKAVNPRHETSRAGRSSGGARSWRKASPAIDTADRQELSEPLRRRRRI